jgi:hypothetical protein
MGHHQAILEEFFRFLTSCEGVWISLFSLAFPREFSDIRLIGYKRAEVVTAVKNNNVVFWVMTPYSVVGGYRLPPRISQYD